MTREYADGDIDTTMRLWLDTNIQVQDFISPDYRRSNFDMVKEMLPHAEVYVHEDDRTIRTYRPYAHRPKAIAAMQRCYFF